MGTIYDQFIDACWQKHTRNSNRSYITVSEVPGLVREMETFLGVSMLLSKQEIAIVDKMAKEKPTLKLFQRDVERFLLRLVKIDSMEAFLRKRANTSKFTLTRLLDNFTSYSRGSWGSRFRPKSEPEDTIRSREKEVPKAEFVPSWEPDLPKSEPTESTFTLPWFRGKKEEKVKQQKSENDIEDSRTSDLRGSKNSYGDDPKELRKKIAQLEKLCARYESQLAQKDNPQRTQLLEKFKAELDQQDKLIKSLQEKMGMGGPATTKDIIVNLPFIKQYLQRGPKTTVPDVVALVLASVVMLNVVKFVYYISLMLLSGFVGSGSSNTTVTFSWLQQLPWLEYWVYSIADWLEG